MILTILLTVLFTAGSIWSGDWTMFHQNPRHTADASGETLRSPMKRLFRCALGGRIYASPVVRGDTLYVGTTQGDFFALNARTGSEFWSIHLPGGIRSTAAIGGNLVVFGCMDSAIYAYRTDGRFAWKVKGCGPVTASVTYAADKRTFYAGDWGGVLYSLDTSGAERWRFSFYDYRYNAELLYGCAYDSGCLVVPYGDGHMRLLQDTGRGFIMRWVNDVTNSGGAPIGQNQYSSAPVVYKGLIFCNKAGPEWNSWMAARRWADGTSSYEIHLYGGSCSFSTPAVGNDVVYACWNHRTPTPINYLTGSAGTWSFGSRSLSGMALSASHAVLQTEDGVFYLLNRSNGTVAYSDTFAAPGLKEGFRGSRSAPAISNGRVFFGSDEGALFCYGDTTGGLNADQDPAASVVGAAINIFPSPANPATELQYSLPAGQSKGWIRILNASGREILVKPLDANKGRIQIPFQGLASGLYIARIESRGVRLSRNFTLIH